MIRKMQKEDAEAFFRMAEQFYSSDAVLHPIPLKHHRDTFNEMMRSDVYAEGYILEFQEQPAGYAITSKTYSNEAGGITIWIDELYVMEKYRSQGIGKEFLNYLQNHMDHSVARVRLEVEADNDRAIRFYQRMGFHELEYKQMFMDRS